jgi:hypothetical protein
MSIGGTSQTVKSVEKPWKEAEPYLKDIMNEAQEVYRSDQGSKYYPFSTYVPASNQSETALQMIENRAMDGSPLIDQAVDQTQNIMSGSFFGGPAQTYLTATAEGENLYGTPYLDRTFNQAADKISDRVNQSAGLNGRVGSGAHQKLLQSQLGNLANDLYGQNYQRERDRQFEAAGQLQGAYESDFARRMAAITAAQSLAQVPYQDAQALKGVGAQRELGAQGQLNDLMARYDFEQQAPWSRLGQYNAVLGGMGNLGGTKRQTTTRQSNPFESLLSLFSIFG